MSKTVFHVSRSSKTGKTVNVGDFDTLDAAREAMLSHYKVTPKRGNFYYRISEDEDEKNLPGYLRQRAVQQEVHG